MPSNVTPLYSFSSKIIYFAQKQPIKVQIFEIIECPGNLMSILSWQVSSSSNLASFLIVMTHNSLVNLSSCIFYFGSKDPIKVPILRILSALMKSCQIPHVIFGSTVSFPSNFASIFSAIKRNYSMLCKLKYYMLWSKAIH